MELASQMCAIVSIALAVYGVYVFTNQYTCRLTKFNKSFNTICKKASWIPSALCIVFVLGGLVFNAPY